MKNNFKKQKDIIEIYSKENAILIDYKNFNKVCGHSWYIHNNGYATTRKKGKLISMQGLLFGKRNGLDLDHINRNKLDNREKNLRFVSRSVNMLNQGKNGISWDKKRKKWFSFITVNYKMHALGRYSDKKDAIDARRNAEMRLIPNL
jgi:hypothetical protein